MRSLLDVKLEPTKQYCRPFAPDSSLLRRELPSSPLLPINRANLTVTAAREPRLRWVLGPDHRSRRFRTRLILRSILICGSLAFLCQTQQSDVSRSSKLRQENKHNKIMAANVTNAVPTVTDPRRNTHGSLK